MRLASAFLLLLPSAAWADDVPARADVIAATIYPSGATVTRAAAATLPPGRHRLLVPLPGGGAPPDVTVAGAALTGVTLLPEAGLDLEALDTAAQAEARAALEAAVGDTRAARRDVAAAKGALEAARTRLDWIDTLTGGGEGALPGPRGGDALTTLLATLGQATRDAVADRVAAQADLDRAEEALKDAQEAERRARAALDRLAPLPDAVPVLAIALQSDGGPVDARIEGFEPAASWSPRYDAVLDTVAGTLALDRKVEVVQYGAEVWTDVALRLSTERPSGATSPSAPVPDPARAFPQVVPLAEGEASLMREQALDLPAPVARADLAVVAAVPAFRGLSVTYDLPGPVTLRPGATAVLALDTLALDARTQTRAAPRDDDVGYLVAEVTNPTAEPILPGAVVLTRDGARVGEAVLPFLAAGAETELGFGPVETVRLTWTRLERGEGDAGVFRRASTLREAVAFEVENTGAAPREVLALYALPFSEQEEVGVAVRADPAPDLRDWDDRRGVAGWRMDLAPGETRRVEIVVEIDWPEGRFLDWEP